ncbi:MAG: alpha/beta hydrolase [Clostridia bacterium]|nr:alpha/beta hydrolase [Clostridia bacterium]
MKLIEKIDLYKEFNIARPQGASGYLNAYIPSNCEEISLSRKRPAIIVVPGGGYNMVSEREKEPVALKYLAKGYASFTLEYSCAPLKYPCAHLEGAMGVAYVRKNAELFGVNENNIACVGFSAGGHLVGCLANCFNREELNVLGKAKALIKPNACIMIYPVVTYAGHVGSFNSLCGDNEELKSELSIEKCVTSESVPCYIAHTCGDTCVPVFNSLLLATAYEKAGVPFSLHVFENGEHGMSLNDITCDSVERLKARKKCASPNFPSWLEESLIWLNERGFEIKD